jgi:dihydrofolate synthase/folylpolyglutamate synthase
MTRKTLADWLRWQESLSPHDIDLGLDRVKAVAQRLSLEVPAGKVFTVAGTNGKGSTAGFLERLMTANGLRTGLYTSPHLVHYNERIQVDGAAVDDGRLIEAFKVIDAARGEIPLTYFEFGTLAAWVVFSEARADAWILEVGLGGRLDAVNAIDPDFSLITTIGLDHQEWLGETIESIAAEKAGILRSGAAAFYGDRPGLSVIEARAAALGASLSVFGREFVFEADAAGWTWRSPSQTVSELPLPELADGAQLRNISLALAAAGACDERLLNRSAVIQALRAARPAGRLQIVERAQEWVLDVAHNPQAAGVLSARLGTLRKSSETTAVVGMLADKEAGAFTTSLAERVDRWVVCAVDDSRAERATTLAARVEAVTGKTADVCATPDEAFECAARVTAKGGRILVCGSFRIVGPALRWLGLY